MPNYVARWLAVIAWCALIFFLSAQSLLPGPAQFVLDALFKKAGHFTAYAVLMLLVLRALNVPASMPRRPLLLAFAWVGAYAVSDELHQTLVPGRTGQAIDVLIDLSGAAGGAAVYSARRGAGWARNRYWLVWSLATWALLLLNLPWRNLPEQDPAVLFRDPVLIWGFSHFGVLIVCILALWFEDAAWRPTRAAWLALPFMVLGATAFAPYLALRPRVEASAPRALPLGLARPAPRWFWGLMLALAVLNLAWLSGARWDAFVQAQLRFFGIGFMWLDIVLCQGLALPLLDAAARRRGGALDAALACAVALLGPFALCAWLVRRKPA